MQITNSVTDGIMTIGIVGTLNYDGANDLKQFLSGVYSQVSGMIIDMAEMEYVSSAGMRVILEAELQMKKKQGLEIINVNDIVMDALHLSGFDKFLKIRK